MSITLGLYDLFANIIPGFIYLFVLNEMLRELGLVSIDITKIDNLTYFLLLGLLAYLVGHNMDYLSYRLWIRVFYRDYPEERAYKQFKATYPDLKIGFVPRQSSMLFSAIKYRKSEVANDIEKNKVICIMLRNISFASILFTLLQTYMFLIVSFSSLNLILAIVSLIASIVTLRRADLFNVLFYRLVFEHAALFGDNLEEVIDYSRKNVPEAKSANKINVKSNRRKVDA
jgi:hypothetical protein